MSYKGGRERKGETEAKKKKRERAVGIEMSEERSDSGVRRNIHTHVERGRKEIRKQEMNR